MSPPILVDTGRWRCVFLGSMLKTTQSAYMNDKLHKSNKLREINDINTPSLSIQKSNHSALEIRA